MKRSIVLFLIGLLCVAGSLQAGQKIYEGREAAALRCANALAFTAVALEENGSLSAAEKEIMLQITVLILERHVSGTWSQKKAALKIVRDRRDVPDILADFERYAQTCFEEFSIN